MSRRGRLANLLRDESGASSEEYSLLAALAGAIVVGVGLVGDELSIIFDIVKDALLGADSPNPANGTQSVPIQPS